MRLSFLFTLILLFFTNCETSNDKSPAIEKTEATTEIKENEAQIPILPLTNAQKQLLIENCTGIEATFYFSGQSMSSPNCNSFFSMLDISVPSKLTKKELGHVVFLASGEQISLAKIHLSATENYLAFSFNDSTFYANLNESGVKFLNGLAGVEN